MGLSFMFWLGVRKAQGRQAARLGFGVEEEDPTGVQENRYQGLGLAHIPAHGRNHARRHGRTPTHDPGLLVPRQSACDQQVSSGDDNEQTAGTGKAGGCDSARRRAVGKQVNSGPLTRQRPHVQPNSADKGQNMSDSSKVLIEPKRTQIVFGGLCKPFKRMAGTTGLEPAASAVTGQRSNQLNYVPTRQVNEMRIMRLYTLTTVHK